MKRKITALTMAFALLAPSAAYAFQDTQSHWARQYIDYAQKNNLISGYNANTYGPNDPVTRAQFATMILKYKNGTPITATFPDVPASEWFNGYVGYVANRKVMNGYPDGSFRPNATVSRAEVAHALYSMEYAGETAGSHGFTDALPDWAANAINVTAKHGIFSGDTQKRFRPNESLTRAEAAVIFAKMRGFVAKEEPKPVGLNKFPGMNQADQRELDAILKEIGADDNYTVTPTLNPNFPNDYYVYLPNHDIALSVTQNFLGVDFAINYRFVWLYYGGIQRTLAEGVVTGPQRHTVEAWVKRDIPTIAKKLNPAYARTAYEPTTTTSGNRYEVLISWDQNDYYVTEIIYDKNGKLLSFKDIDRSEWDI